MKTAFRLREIRGAARARHWFVVVLLLLSAVCARAEESAAPFVPDRRELWVPADKLKEVLAKNPKAIVLSKEQYETLLRDAGRETKKAPEPPRPATLSSARYTGRAEGETLRMKGELLIEVLGDEWTQVALPAWGISVGLIRIDGEAALLGTAPKTGILLVRGRGQHKLATEFTAAISSKAGEHSFNLGLPAAATGLFEVALQGDVEVESPAPMRIEKRAESTWVSIAPAPSASSLGLKWKATGAAGKSVFLQHTAIAYALDAEQLRAEFNVTLVATLGNLPAELLMTIPKGAQLLQIEGAEVSKWSVANERVRVQLQPRERNSTEFKLVIEAPSLTGAPAATLTLPVVKVDGVQRMEGSFLIDADLAGVSVHDVVTDSSTVQTSSGDPRVPGRVAGFTFNGALQAPRVSLVKVESRLNADLDTLVEFKPEAVFLERTLTLKEAHGAFFSASLKLPSGEELLRVFNADGSEPDWRVENGSLQLRWSDRSAQPRVFKISSRTEPKGWAGLDGIVYTVADLQIEGVGKITGYIALKADAAFRLEAQPSETLEQRDGRTTPVRGDYAWFRRNEFTLAVKVSRLPGETVAELTGYALPLEGMLDVHAQIGFTFLRSGVRSVRIQVPERIATAFHFEGPQIAERNLVGDIWTIVFQKELTGAYALAITVQVPIPKEGADTFKVEVPLIEPLDVKRVSGVWAVEANTETEISFTLRGMNELDSLLAPLLPGYTPRHRVIGVFNYLGGDHSLALAGVRHSQAEVLSSVVDELNLEAVVSTSGTERNQATIQLRSAGAQFLDVTLPAGSKLWSLTVNDELVKPVGDKAGMVRIQLPARIDPRAGSSIILLYETPKPAWHSRGVYDLTAPRLSKSIPILKSNWQIYLPDGFQYTGFKSNLRPPVPSPEPLLVRGIFEVISSPWEFLRARRRVQSTRILSDLRMVDESVTINTAELSAAPQAPGISPAEEMQLSDAVPENPLLPHAAKPDSAKPLLNEILQKGPSPIMPAAQEANLTPAGIAGLLPIKMELARAGQPMTFEGLYDAQSVAFHYEDSWARARRLWFWLIGGALLFLGIGGWRHPWWRSVWAMLILSFIPLCISETATPVCNALLCGWLAALLLHQIAVRFTSAKKEVTA